MSSKQVWPGGMLNWGSYQDNLLPSWPPLIFCFAMELCSPWDEAFCDFLILTIMLSLFLSSYGLPRANAHHWYIVLGEPVDRERYHPCLLHYIKWYHPPTLVAVCFTRWTGSSILKSVGPSLFLCVAEEHIVSAPTIIIVGRSKSQLCA